MSGVTPSRRVVGFVGCFLMAAGINLYILAPASILPLIVADFGITKAEAGWAITVSLIGWFLVQFLSGYLTDRADNRLLVAGGVGLYLVGSVSGTLVSTYPAFLVTRFVGGAAPAFLWATNANIVAQLFPGDREGTATGIFLASGSLGLALAQITGPPIATMFEWESVFLVFPVPAVIGLALLYAATDEAIYTGGGSVERFRDVLTRPEVMLISAASFCTYMLFFFLNSWMPTYGTEVLELDLQLAGIVASAVAFVGVIARPVGGWLAERFGSTRNVVLGGFGLTVPVFASITAISSPLLFGLSLLVAGFATQVTVGAYYPYVTSVSSPESVGGSIALLSAASVLGSLVAPVFFGYLIALYSWVAGFAVAGLFVAGGITFVWLTPDG